MADYTRRAFLGFTAATAALAGVGASAIAFAGEGGLLRPPGGQDEGALVAACVKCDRCRFDPQRDKLGVAVVQKDRCIAYFEGCVECEKACPYEAIALDDVGHPVIDAAKCNGCGVCENVCPALVYRSFAGGSRRGVVVVAPERYERLGRTTVEGESEMIV